MQTCVWQAQTWNENKKKETRGLSIQVYLGKPFFGAEEKLVRIAGSGSVTQSFRVLGCGRKSKYRKRIEYNGICFIPIHA